MNTVISIDAEIVTGFELIKPDAGAAGS